MSDSRAVTASYRRVRRISRRSGSNFYRSFWLLPQRKRAAMYALYAFARTTDDLGDCDAPVSDRTGWLTWWRKTAALNLERKDCGRQVLLAEMKWQQNDDGSPSSTPIDLPRRAGEVFPALCDAATRYRIPTRYLLEIIDGVMADQQKTRFDTYEQLEHYCYLVATAVGLACLHIWEFKEPLPMESTIACGLAFQMTNILRDVAEDAQRGRIYLPRQHYEKHGLSEDDLLVPRPDDRLKCLIEEEVDRTRELFRVGWHVWDSLHPDGQPMFSMIWRTYRKLLDRVAEDPGSVAVRRIGLSPGEQIGLVASHFLSPMFRRLPVPPLELGDARVSPS